MLPITPLKYCHKCGVVSRWIIVGFSAHVNHIHMGDTTPTIIECNMLAATHELSCRNCGIRKNFKQFGYGRECEDMEYGHFFKISQIKEGDDE